MKKYTIILYFLMGLGCFFLSGCEDLGTDVTTLDISESVEFSEQENNEENDEENKEQKDSESTNSKEEEEDHGTSLEEEEATPFIDDGEENNEEDNEREKITAEENESTVSHASASSPRNFSLQQREEILENKMKENGAAELHISDAVRLIFEEEILTGFCNESGDCTFDIKLGTDDFNIEEGNVIVIWDLSKRYYFQKEILLVLKVEEEEEIFHITAEIGDQSYVFYNTSFSSKEKLLTTEESILMTTEQIDSIENKRGILTDDEKDLLVSLQSTLEREQEQYEREKQEKETKEEQSDLSLEEDKQENISQTPSFQDEEENQTTTPENQNNQQKTNKEKREEHENREEIEKIKQEEKTQISETTKKESSSIESKENTTQKNDEEIMKTFQKENQEIETTINPQQESFPIKIPQTTQKPTGNEKLYKVCGTFSFGKMYSYYLCEIEDLDKQKEVFSKKLGDLAKLEDFSDFFYIKADIQGDELLYRTIIDKFTEKDLGQLNQEEFDQTFDFVNNHYHHTVTYKDEIRLSKLKEGETYTFRFDPQNGETAKPKINNDTLNNVIVFTYSEGSFGGYEINLYPSYTFPDIPHYSFSSADEKKYYLTFKTISAEDFVKYAKPENVVSLSQGKLNTELEREKSYFYNDTNQTFTLFVKNSPYTNMPGTEGTKREIKPGQIFGGPHAINTFMIMTPEKITSPLETTKVIPGEEKNLTTNQKTTSKINSEEDTTGVMQEKPLVIQSFNQSVTEKTNSGFIYSVQKVLAPAEIYRDELIGFQVKNMSRYSGLIEIIETSEENLELNDNQKYIVSLYHFVPEKIGSFSLINPAYNKKIAKEKGFPNDFLDLAENVCFSKSTCFKPGGMFGQGEIKLNKQGFNMEYYGGRQESMYSDEIFLENYDTNPKKIAGYPYQSEEEYRKQLEKLTQSFRFEVKGEGEEENKITPKVKVIEPTVQTISAEVIKKEIKSDPIFYTKNLGLYPSQGLQIDSNGNLINPQQTKEIMQKLGFCGEETSFSCGQGVQRFEKEKVGKLFIYTVGKWNRETDCKGKKKEQCYTPEGNIPFFTTKKSTKEGFVYLYPAKNVKLCVLQGNITTC